MDERPPLLHARPHGLHADAIVNRPIEPDGDPEEGMEALAWTGLPVWGLLLIAAGLILAGLILDRIRHHLRKVKP